jgi:hypothetical protein
MLNGNNQTSVEPQETEDEIWRRRIEKINRFLAEHLDGNPLVADWELDDIVKLGNEWGIKFGVYPWGKTIFHGTLAELGRVVKEILRELEHPKYSPQCPGCHALLSSDVFTCACGYTWAPTRSIAIQLIADAFDGLPSGLEFGQTLVTKHGAALDDVFTNVVAVETRNDKSPIIGVARRVGLRPISSMHPLVAYGYLMSNLGFKDTNYVAQNYGVEQDVICYEGEVDGASVHLLLNEICGPDDDGSFDLVIAIDSDTLFDPIVDMALSAVNPAESERQDLEWIVSEFVSDEWPNFLNRTDENRQGWTLDSWAYSTDCDNYEVCASRNARELLAGSTSLDATARDINGAINHGLSVLRDAVSAFVAEVSKQSWQFVIEKLSEPKRHRAIPEANRQTAIVAIYESQETRQNAYKQRVAEAESSGAKYADIPDCERPVGASRAVWFRLCCPLIAAAQPEQRPLVRSRIMPLISRVSDFDAAAMLLSQVQRTPTSVEEPKDIG